MFRYKMYCLIWSFFLERGGEKEWYYGNADKERNGPVGFTDIKDLYKVNK